jgi:hypothetical protein
MTVSTYNLSIFWERFTAKGASLAWFLVGDLIAAMHLIFITGMLTYDPGGQVIPPIHEMTTSMPLALVILSYISYQIGRILAGRSHSISTTRAEPEPPGWIFLLCTSVVAVVVVSFQTRLLLQLGSLEAAALSKAETTQELGPMARLIYTGLPFLAGVLWHQSAFHKKYRTASYLLAGACLFALLLTLFKGQVLLFALTLLYLTLCARSNDEPSLREVIRSPFFLSALAGIVAMFLLSEGESVLGSIWYVIGRASIYSWEGLAYVVEAPAAPDLESQVLTFLGRPPAGMLSPDLELASEMLGISPPPIGVVITFPGFLFRNFGSIGVAVGAIVLGYLARKALRAAARTSLSERAVFGVMFYFCLVHIFLVGNVFNTIRGDIATLVATYAIVRGMEVLRRLLAQQRDLCGVLPAELAESSITSVSDSPTGSAERPTETSRVPP